MIEPEHPQLSIVRQCELVSISRSGFYYRPAGETPVNLELMRLIDTQFLEAPWYGSRQMARHLRREGYTVGRKRVRRLMAKMGLAPIYQRPRTTVPHPEHRVHPYLLRDLAIDRPNQVWCADITYIPMRRGFLYLVAIMDWMSRKVLAWRVSNTMDVEFCLEALEEALARFGKPEIFNTDQGSQFTSPRFTGVLQEAGIRISMDGRGRWMDNVFIERLWRSLKYECVVCCECLVPAGTRAELYRRWGTAPRSRPAGAGFKPPQAARVKSPRGERCWKRRKLFRQVGLEETNASEPLMTCRNVFNRRRNRDRMHIPRAKVGRSLLTAQPASGMKAA
jgi:putative transposase